MEVAESARPPPSSVLAEEADAASCVMGCFEINTELAVVKTTLIGKRATRDDTDMLLHFCKNHDSSDEFKFAWSLRKL